MSEPRPFQERWTPKRPTSESFRMYVPVHRTHQYPKVNKTRGDSLWSLGHPKGEGPRGRDRGDPSGDTPGGTPPYRDLHGVEGNRL